MASDSNDMEVNENLVEASSIQAIDKQSVHRICSGQVVLNLATAVKELIENGLDAGANTVEVRLKEYGSELLEVVDNGSGVKKDNFEGLTLKHHTSKLRDFCDLTSVDTFGFRGEALSSLCALSKMTITTCHKTDEIGSKLEYDHNGRLVSTTPCARQTGTTVTLQNLFSTLPVRHKEFNRNLKKEFNKMVQVLNAYCIISTKVKLTCTNQIGTGKKNTIVNINDNETMKENITNIFGAKQMQSLVDFTQHNPGEEQKTEYNIQHNSHKVFNITGFISTCEHKKGRSATDRQFFFVNKRPCDLVKVSRVVNEVYHMYNRHQYPFVVLEINLDKDSVDVNVTPDKRQVFMENEKLLLAIIKTSLMKIFEPLSSMYTINPGIQKVAANSPSIRSAFLKHSDNTPPMKSHQSSPAYLMSKVTSTETSNSSPNLMNLKRSFSSAFAKDDQTPSHKELSEEQQNKQRKLDMFVIKSQQEKSDKNEKFDDDEKQTTDTSNRTQSEKLADDVQMDVSDTDSTSHRHSPSEQKLTPNLKSYKLVYEEIQDGHSCTGSTGHDDLQKIKGSEGDSPRETLLMEDKRNSDWCQSPLVNSSVNNSGGNPSQDVDLSTVHSSKYYGIGNEECVSKGDLLLGECERREASGKKKFAVTITEIDEKVEDIKRKEKTVNFSLQKLREKAKKRENGGKDGGSTQWCRAFRAKITPGDNKSAEQELSKQISKDMFPQMEILGQFNLGFIIGKLQRDLFIIDQHATDEKYNFEVLQRDTIITNQKLIQPQVMELTAANETILMDNLDVFHKNGFDFVLDEEAPPTERVKLVSMPVSKNWTFGKEDIEELIFMLSDSPGVMCRPSRVRMMFASRACRKSIMIGTALNTAEMKKLVHHMSEIEQPWNCPHGRPTMRHLINLDMLPQ